MRHGFTRNIPYLTLAPGARNLIKRFIRKIGLTIKLSRPDDNNQTIGHVIPPIGIEILFALALLVPPLNRRFPIYKNFTVHILLSRTF
jgi:hypothetical protein